MRGANPTLSDRTGYHSQVPMGLEKSCFKAIHLAPTKFSGQISQPTKWLWSKSKPPTRHGSRALLCQRSGADYKGPPWYRRERNYYTFQTLMRTKEPLFCHIQMRSVQDHRWQQGADKQWLFFCVLFPPPLHFLFNSLALVSSIIKVSILNP